LELQSQKNNFKNYINKKNISLLFSKLIFGLCYHEWRDVLSLSFTMQSPPGQVKQSFGNPPQPLLTGRILTILGKRCFRSGKGVSRGTHFLFRPISLLLLSKWLTMHIALIHTLYNIFANKSNFYFSLPISSNAKSSSQRLSTSFWNSSIIHSFPSLNIWLKRFCGLKNSSIGNFLAGL